MSDLPVAQKALALVVAAMSDEDPAVLAKAIGSVTSVPEMVGMVGALAGMVVLLAVDVAEHERATVYDVLGNIGVMLALAEEDGPPVG